MIDPTAAYLRYMGLIQAKTNEIRTATECGDWDAVLTGLEARQNLMGLVDGLPSETRGLVGGNREHLLVMLSAMIEEDQRALDHVQGALMTTRASMDDSNRARTTVTAYRKSGTIATEQASARFIDRHS